MIEHSINKMKWGLTNNIYRLKCIHVSFDNFAVSFSRNSSGIHGSSVLPRMNRNSMRALNDNLKKSLCRYIRV